MISDETDDGIGEWEAMREKLLTGTVRTIMKNPALV
jgi:hypothetical protein